MMRSSCVRTGILLVLVLLPATACSSKKTTATNGITAPGPALSTLPLPSPDPTLTPDTTLPGQPASGPRDTAPPSTSTTAPVNVTVTMFKHVDQYSPECGYGDQMKAKIIVDRATDVTWQFIHNGNPVTPPIPYHISGAGTTVPTYDFVMSPVVPVTTIFDELVVKWPGGQTVSDIDHYQLVCTSFSGTVSASPATYVCPYVTTFSVKVSVQVGPQTSAYKWVFDDKSVVTGSLTFPGTGPQSQVVTVKRPVQIGSTGVSAAFQANEHGATTAPATATCSI